MKYGLLGHKIAYSLSPVIHKMINKSGIQYEILDVSPEELNDRLPEMTKDFSGFNITIPHKQSIMELCDEIDPLAARIAAVNTVQICNGRWKGYNTDYLGFVRTVKENIPDFLSYQPVIIGYGGVARAVLFGLEELGYQACTVYGGELESERKDFIIEMGSSSIMAIESDLSDKPKLWINCTPIGGAKLPDIPEGFIAYGEHDLLYDLNYAPFPTYLEKDAQSKGLKTLNGMKMLVSQAIEAQKIWNKDRSDLHCDTDKIIRSLVDGNSVS